MKCRECGTEMEREDCFEKKFIKVKRDGSWQEIEIEVPAAIYACPDCGSEYFWSKGSKLRIIDKSDAIPVDNFAKNLTLDKALAHNMQE